MTDVKRYRVSLFSDSTFLVIDDKNGTEMCVCGDYEYQDLNAEGRAMIIAAALNKAEEEKEEDK